MVFEARVLRIFVEARFSEHGKSFGALRAGVLYTGDGVKFAGRRFVRFAKLLHDKLTEGIILHMSLGSTVSTAAYSLSSSRCPVTDDANGARKNAGTEAAGSENKLLQQTGRQRPHRRYP